MKELDKLLEENIGILFPGVVYSLVSKDKIIYNSLGDTNIEMYYDLASLTKVIVTNTMISIALEEEKIKLEDKLNMKYSHFNRMDKSIDKKLYVPLEKTSNRGLVQGYVHDENAYYLGGISGNAGLFSNIRDVSLFVKMILNDGGDLLGKSIIDMWFRLYNENRTLGWEYYKDGVIFHTGFSGTCIFINRNKELGIVILSNRLYYGRDNTRIYDLYKEIFKMFS